MNDEISRFDSLLAALSEHLGKTKEPTAKSTLVGYVVPLLKEMRKDTLEAFESLQEQIETLEEDSINGKAENLVDKARELIMALGAAIDTLLVADGYILDGKYTEKFEAVKSQIGAGQNGIASWFHDYAAYSEALGDDEDEDEDEDDGDGEPKQLENAA